MILNILKELNLQYFLKELYLVWESFVPLILPNFGSFLYYSVAHLVLFEEHGFKLLYKKIK